jgi:hypothetical protein
VYDNAADISSLEHVIDGGVDVVEAVTPRDHLVEL